MTVATPNFGIGAFVLRVADRACRIRHAEVQSAPAHIQAEIRKASKK